MSAYYTKPLPDYGDVIPVADFLELCRTKAFTDYDGLGEPVRNGMVDESITVKPSRLDLIPADATHIVWFNR